MQPLQVKAPSSEHAADSTRILLVDDQPANLEALRAVLCSLGHEIVLAHSGREALRRLLEDDNFAVVLLDVCMPDLDGFQTASFIRSRERTQDIPIVFLTAYSDGEAQFHGYSQGAVDFMYKPIQPQVLRSKVSVFVELSRKNRLLREQAAALQARNRELEVLIDEKLQAEAEVRAFNAGLERRVAERTAELTRVNEELRQFAYAASHDLREPLRTVACCTQLLLRRVTSDDPDVREQSGFIIEGVKRMIALLDDLLDYSRAGEEELHAAPISLQQPLETALANLASAIAESRARVICNGLPHLAADPSGLARVFQNLIGNAIKYRSGDPPCITVTAREEPAAWVVSVRDNGIGIDGAHHERIFGIFKRLHGRETPGTGIGLAICKKIVERHGGSIWVISEKGKGCDFQFSLPKQRAAAEHVA